MAPRSTSRRLPTGCLTCRIRKVKCDGERPTCLKCTSTGRRCDGYSDIPFSRDELKAASRHSSAIARVEGVAEGPSELVHTLISDANFRDAAEKRYFQFFRQCTVKETNFVIDSRFWDRVVLQASHAEPAVKHAVLALGSYHNSAIRKDDEDSSSRHVQYADEQFVKALSEARTLVATSSTQQIERVLMVCILFIIYEGMRGNYALSQAHMDHARAIAAQHRKNSKETNVRSRLSEVFEMMARLDILMLNFSDAAAPYRYTLDQFLATGPDLQPGPFSDIQAASAVLVNILRWMLVLGYEFMAEGTTDGDSARVSHLHSEMTKCGERLHLWRQHWDDLISTREDLRRTPPALTVECWFTTAEVIFDVGLGGAETSFDSALPRFTRIVDLGETIASAIAAEAGAASFSLDIGFVIPMFLTAIRCRDPYIRRRAIKVLKSHKRQEGMWGSRGAAAIAMRWVEAEERGLENVEKTKDVPAANRISRLYVHVDSRQSTASVQFHKINKEEADQLSSAEEVGWGGQSAV